MFVLSGNACYGRVMCILKIARCVPFVFGSIVLFLVPACQSAIPNKSEFVRTVNFSKLQSFRYKHTLATGMEWRDAQRILLEELTCKVINEEFESRGFERGESDADMVAVVKWRKAASAYQNPMDCIDGPFRSLSRVDAGSSFSPRISVIVELYEGPEETLFWRKELYNAFDAIQLTTDRITRTLEKAVENFPDRIEMDPSLPSIE